MIIAHQCLVSIHYRLTDDHGALLDTSYGKLPMEYIHGRQQIVPGLERALAGKTTGDHLVLTLQPAEGYGLRDPSLIKTMPRSALEGLEPLASGMCFEAIQPDGRSKLMTIQAVMDDTVMVDQNHPLAGQVLHFDVRIESVKNAFTEELTGECLSVV